MALKQEKEKFAPSLKQESWYEGFTDAAIGVDKLMELIGRDPSVEYLKGFLDKLNDATSIIESKFYNRMTDAQKLQYLERKLNIKASK